MSSAQATPAMRQYLDAKDQHRDSLMLFRMGDFYEMFYEDALVAARALELTLTSRSKDANGGAIPMCGVPHHAIDTYIARLVKKGFRVAICDQVEDPKKAKGIVKREVVRVVSPGTLTDANFLDAREPAFLMAISPANGKGETVGVALLDLSTGEFTAAEYDGADGTQALADELSLLKPREIVAPAGAALPSSISGAGIPLTTVDAWTFDGESARRTLLTQLRANGLEGFGLDGHLAAVSAAGALVHHLRSTQKVDLAHVSQIAFRQRADTLLIDPTTLEHLEVLEGSEGGRQGSLLDEIDRTMTSMGSRLLRSWLLRPLVAIEPIRDRLDAEVDDLRRISRSGKQVIAEMEEAERARTGINSLKIRYNRVFGYYIEISKSNLHAVPPDYHRKQTVAGGERFITPALKEYEEKVLGADERILEREIEILNTLRSAVAAEAPRIQMSARALAALDVLASLADVASNNNYIKPQIHDGDDMIVVDGRHPVVERHAVPGSGAAGADGFVPNDIALNGTNCQLIILTGPNMGGKSTYLRQTALLCLMAQAGSFVPARSAKMPIIDRIFARVGASDNIARGQSTFMVEMQETANILHQATSRSLVVIDEIGRGTSTFDGLSIAWAVAEYLARHPKARPKTLFATHYHELTDLADLLPGVINAHVAAREWQDDIVFLHKIVPGRSDRSYGIQVARLAGMPAVVITRARAILQALEHDALAPGGPPSISGTPAEPQRQLGLFQAPVVVDEKAEKVAQRLRDLDTNALTPLQALTILAELKKDAE